MANPKDEGQQDDQLQDEVDEDEELDEGAEEVEDRPEEGTEATDEPGEGAAEYKEQLLRTLADFENYKRRTADEQARLVAVARTDVILNLLPVIDNFERAFKTVPESIEKDPWYGGVTAIKQQFESVLKGLGIERVVTVGKDFDPNVHEAIVHEPSDEYEENVVSEEFEAGYTLGDEIIRHARVKVSSGKK